MRPDEWTQGLENEAASVEDGAWAREARRAARKQRLARQWRQISLTLLTVEVWLLLANALSVRQGLSVVQSRPWFDSEAQWMFLNLSLMVAATFVTGLLLGTRRVSVALALPLFLAFPLFQVINGLLVPRPGRPFPDSTLEALDLYPRIGVGDLSLYFVSPWYWIQASAICLGLLLGLGLGTRRHQTSRA